MQSISKELFNRIQVLAERNNCSVIHIFKTLKIPVPMYNLYCMEHDLFLSEKEDDISKCSELSRLDLLSQLIEDDRESKNKLDVLLTSFTYDLIRKTEDETFFVWLDIMGFKNLVCNSDSERLKQIVAKFIAEFDKAFDESRTIEYDVMEKDETGKYIPTRKERERIGLDFDFNFRIFSDSIIIWTNSVEHRVIMNLLDALVGVVRTGLKTGFPLRGVLTYGNVFSYSSHDNCFLKNESIYGKALVEAYTFEEAMNWSGCLVTPVAWKIIQKNWSSDSSLLTSSHSSTDVKQYLFGNGKWPRLVWYTIPMHKEKALSSTQWGIAINWCEDILKSDIERAFHTEGDNVYIKDKLRNTLGFYDYCNNVKKTSSPNYPPDSYDFSIRKRKIFWDSIKHFLWK